MLLLFIKKYTNNTDTKVERMIIHNWVCHSKWSAMGVPKTVATVFGTKNAVPIIASHTASLDILLLSIVN